MQRGELFLQPQPGRDQHLVVAAAAGVDALARVAQALGEARFDRRMPVLIAVVEDERAAAEIVRQHAQLTNDASQLAGGKHADPLQAFGMRLAGGDVVQEELAVQDHVVAGEEGLDPCVDRDAGFLPK
jgi:hypothetical protein